MKLFILSILTVLISYSNTLSQQREQGELEKNFKNPPHNVKPRTWYHVNSNNMSKEGFTKDLEAIDKAGIGGILVFNVSMGLPEGDVLYNSKKHRDILTHGAKECEKRGLSFGVHNCDGWTSSGGPWVKPEHSMKIVVNSQTITQGGENLELALPQPPTRYDYYKDIAVVAYPSLATELLDQKAKPIITSSYSGFDKNLAVDKKIDTYADLKAKEWVQYDFGAPYTIQSISLFINKRKGSFELLKSDDGKNFTLVRKPKVERIGKDECYFLEHFKAVTARYFRIVAASDCGIYEMDLSANYVLGNALEFTSYRRQRRPIGTPKASDIIKKDQIVVLTDKMDASGILTTSLPKGNWTIMRFGYTTSGAVNEPASEEGTGLEVDKLSREALKIHYDAFVGKLVKQAKIDAPNALQYVEIDSYEVGPQNWTDGLESIFKNKFGYDFVPFLPMFAGKYIENTETIEDVFWDMKNLVSDLMVANYFDYFTELCHKDGLISYIEPYGFVGPFNSLDAGRSADIPMGEFWLGKPNRHKRAPVSSGHIYGKNVISAEAFTSTKLNWSFHPALAKQKGDYEWTNGINEYMFHRFAHQSNIHVKPGMSMHFVGSHIDRTQTWWESAGPAWFQYLSRGSYMLRQGNPVLDLLVFVGDRAPNHVVHPSQIKPQIPSAYKYDCVNSDVIINRISVEKGQLVLPNGIIYKALILPRIQVISLETLRGIHQLSQQGAVIIGKKPLKYGGYLKTEAMNQEFDQLVAAIWSNPKTYSSDEWETIFEANNIHKDLIVKGQPDFNYYHRRTEDEDIYFIYNHSLSETQVLDCSFLVDGKVPELWRPMNGKVTVLAEYSHNNGRTNVPIQLQPQESVFVVFSKKSDNLPKVIYTPSEQVPAPLFFTNEKSNEVTMLVEGNGTYSCKVNDKQWVSTVTDLPSPIQVNGKWKVDFREEDHYKGSLETNYLFDWSEHELDTIKHYSGTAIYTTSFEVEKGTLQSNREFKLDLGKVNVIASVQLNGVDVGVSWVAPYRLDVTSGLKEGRNELIIKVTNQWTNRLIGDEKLPNQINYEIRNKEAGEREMMPKWFRKNKPLPKGPRTTFSAFSFQKATDKLLPSGLIGPVQILPLKKITKKAI